MTITIENADKELVKIVRSIAKLAKAKVRVNRIISREKGIDKAIREYEKEKDNLKSYANFEEFEKEIRAQQDKTPSWLKEAKDMKQNPHKYKSYQSIDTMFENILR